MEKRFRPYQGNSPDEIIQETDANLQALVTHDMNKYTKVGGAVRPVSFDTCARVNALLKFSSCVLFFDEPEILYPLRVYTIVPSPTPGFVIAECNSIVHNNVKVEIGDGCSFDFRLRIR